jgi:hypothetical protein
MCASERDPRGQIMIIVQAEQQGSSLYTPYYVILNGGHAPRLIFTLLFIPRVTKRNSLRQTRLAQTGSLLSEPFHLRRANNLLRFPSFFLFYQYALHCAGLSN